VAPINTEPLPRVAVDLRLGYPSLGDDELTAAGLGVASSLMPGRAPTIVLGAHAYPLRQSRFKVGIGAEMLMGRGSFQRKDTSGKAIGAELNRVINGVSGQVSLNFGRGLGWSYLTVGAGPFKFDSFAGENPGTGEGSTTLNAGGGGRWFNWDHVGFTVDLRFYLTKASPGFPGTAPRGAARIVVLSGGLTFK
jgi:hypothetical protein